MNAAQTATQPLEPVDLDFASPPHKPLNIALLGYRSHPFVGGQGIYLKYLSSALAALGHMVDVYSGPPYPELDTNNPLIRLIHVPSLDLYNVEDHIGALRWHHLTSFTDFCEWWTMATGGFGEPYSFGRRINKVLKSCDYDIIHDNQSLCYGLLDLQKRGYTVVSTIHHPIHRDRELALQSESRWFFRLLIRRWYSFIHMQERVTKQLKHVVTVSHVSQQDIAEHFKRSPKQTPVISNGIDTDIFKPQATVQRVPYRIITTASADQPLKGLNFLLQAVHNLIPSFPEIHLCVVGKLKTGGKTASLLHQLNLQQHVSFVSGISTEELVQQYARASIAVSPSLYEGFGLPAGEAMACGLPIITSDGGALPEVVGNAGIIVPAGNAAALAEKIALLFNNSQLATQLGLKAREHIEQNFSWTKVAEQLTAFYRDILTHADH